MLAAVVTVTIWTGFIIIARASAQRTLTPFDIALLRITGASLVLMPWGWWMVRRRQANALRRWRMRDGAGSARRYQLNHCWAGLRQPKRSLRPFGLT